MSQEVSESSRPSLPRRLLMTGVKVAVSVALLALLFSRVDVSKLWANARQASLAWIAVALGVYVVTILATVWRWWLLVEAQDAGIPFGALYASMSVALFFNNFLPSSIGGDVVPIAGTATAIRSKTMAAAVVLPRRPQGRLPAY